MDERAGGAWQVQGHDVLGLLGFGTTGEVWRARDETTGELVALKRLRPGAGPEAVAALQREAAVLRALDTPHVVRLRGVLGSGEGTVLVLDHADGGSLAALLLARGRLDPGEVVTLAVPLAEALAAAHARGLVHGDVSPSNVLFAADGMPLLSDLGLARLVGLEDGEVQGTAEYADPAVLAGAPPSPATDVRALAAVVHHALAGTPPFGGGTDLPPAEAVLRDVAAGRRAPLGLLAPQAPRALVAAVESALADDAAARPTAAELALALRRACPALPVRLAEGSGEVAGEERGEAVRPTHRVRPAVPAPQGVEPRRGPRVPVGVLAGLAGVVLLAAAALVGWRLGATQAPVPAPVAAPVVTPVAAPVVTPEADDPARWDAARWGGLLQELHAARERAYAEGDPTALSRTWAPGSPALVQDRATLQALVDAGRRARGLRHEVRAADPVEVGPASARLRVRDVLAAHEVLGPEGAVVARRPVRAEAAFDVELVLTPLGWRLREVRPA